MSRDRDAATRAAADAFEVLGNELRTEIVLELADAETLSFSELRDRVGVADSGRFNYHLEKLVGQFVRRTADGYRLRYHGRRVARAVLAGSFTETASFEPVAADGECLECGEHALEGSYEEEHVRIRCRSCRETLLSVAFPPTAVRDRTPGEAIEAFERWSRRQADLERDGICPECASEVSHRLEDGPSLPLAPVVRHRCAVCERAAYTAVGGAVLDHPDVVAFHAEHGRDPREGPYWSNPYLLTNRHVEVRSRDPWRVAVRFEADGDELVVTVNGELTVVETTAR